MRAALPLGLAQQRSESGVKALVMSVANLVGARVRVVGVYVVAVDQASARPDDVAEQKFSGAVAVARQFAPLAGVVDRGRHSPSLQGF